MISGFRHIGLVVTNLEESKEFWCDLLGFKLVKQMEESGPHIDAMMGLVDVRVTTAKIKCPDGMILELLYFKSHPDKPSWLGTPFSTGLTHIAFTVENLQETYDKLTKVGVTFPASPQTSPDGTVEVIYAKGPEGILLELVEVLS
tara:strand:- start:5125 stop:5559 length:435 start_codon:yes stop_codon:yes gene_type:complete